ncbi:MAG: circularly permuted type 2 ATP-grasp protein [Pseudomonadota bacterium]|nr:circularly permuted type 2 ATP-grasp protein [Pseudomonadota bacterium]
MSDIPITPVSAHLGYPPLQRSGDEVYGPDGTMLPHWQYVMNTVTSLSGTVLGERQGKAQRLLRDDGATYNIYSEDASDSRIWGLDLIPNVIGSEDWADIEAGLLERAELLNLLLRDIYGPRNLIRTGVIPPEVIFANRGFLRACQGIRLPGDHDLTMHAADVVRGPDGRMMVLADRTQSPSGAGYALENRTVMSRVMPSMFRDSHVHRLAGYFRQLRNKMLSLCPHRPNPRVAVLTPGPRNETYFEHAYMANYLGFYLVQSDDLVVRGGFLWMKSLDGLSRVDVLMRRVDDWFCDPVELRGDSRLGVAGLLEVVRAGNLVVANPLGSGILESPALLKYVNEIGRALLGREPRMPSVQTWWCGDAKDAQYVLANLEQLVIKPTYRKPGELSFCGPQASKEQITQMRAMIQADPMRYVAQPLLESSYLPTLNGLALEPRPGILRTFAVAGTGSYSLMPGGLTRVGLEEGAFLISGQTGATSKDTWVVASEPERITTNLPEDTSPVRDSEFTNLPSRVLENLYWMGRYAERAESCLRLLRTSYTMLNGEELLSGELRQVLMTSVSQLATVAFTTPPATDEAMIDSLRQGDAPRAIAGVLNSMLFCADEAKELLSSDTYRVINDIRDAIPLLEAGNLPGGMTPDEVLDPLVTALMALAGLTHESMTRGYGWRFMELGRRVERSMQTAKLVGAMLGPGLPEPDQSRIAEALLLTLEGLITYRRRYGARPDLRSELDLVLLDTDNPRSVMYQMGTILRQLRKLPSNAGYLHELPPAEKALIECSTRVRLSTLSELADVDNGSRKTLLAEMKALDAALMEISDMIGDRYFDHRESSQQLVAARWEGL